MPLYSHEEAKATPTESRAALGNFGGRLSEENGRMSSGLGRRVLAFSAMAVALVGCSLQPRPDTGPSGPTAPSSMPIAASETAPGVVRVEPGTCPDVSGAQAAIEPPLSVGPFLTDLLAPLPPGLTERKLWVASDRDGEDDAIIVVTDPRQRDVRQQRRPSGKATVEGTPQFYPGDIATPLAGAYMIKVTVGADSICMVVRYQ